MNLPLENYFIILGPEQEDSFLYWNNDIGWVEDKFLATTFPRKILTVTLPPGTTGIIEFGENGNDPIGYYLLGGA